MAFNEAVIKLSQEKDRIIEDLRGKEKELLEQLSSNQGLSCLMFRVVYQVNVNKLN